MSEVRVSKATAELLLKEYAEALDAQRSRGLQMSAAFERMNLYFGTDRHPQVMPQTEDALDAAMRSLNIAIVQVNEAIRFAKREGTLERKSEGHDG